MKVHELKIEKKYFGDVCCGLKTFEVRKNDRDYKVGNHLCLREIDENGDYTGNWIEREITYILDDSRFLKEGYVVLGIK